MPSPPPPHRRRSTLRHPHQNYTEAGAYFVTICTAQRACLFGSIVNGMLQLNPLGQIAAAAWTSLLQHHAYAALDEYVVMPNHVHVLLWLCGTNCTSSPRTFGDAVAGSLSILVGAYKSAVTQKARHSGLLAAPALWQRNFYDNIVRDDRALASIREYIRTNPPRWAEDQLHPAAPPNRFNRR